MIHIPRNPLLNNHFQALLADAGAVETSSSSSSDSCAGTDSEAPVDRVAELENELASTQKALETEEEANHELRHVISTLRAENEAFHRQAKRTRARPWHRI